MITFLPVRLLTYSRTLWKVTSPSEPDICHLNPFKKVGLMYQKREVEKGNISNIVKGEILPLSVGDESMLGDRHKDVWYCFEFKLRRKYKKANALDISRVIELKKSRAYIQEYFPCGLLEDHNSEENCSKLLGTFLEALQSTVFSVDLRCLFVLTLHFIAELAFRCCEIKHYFVWSRCLS